MTWQEAYDAFIKELNRKIQEIGSKRDHAIETAAGDKKKIAEALDAHRHDSALVQDWFEKNFPEKQ